jgi:DNA-binding NarL/FixJ family response regulator
MSPLIARWIEADRTRRAHAAFLVEKLRDTEREILVMACNGHASPVIGAAVGISPVAVKQKFKRIQKALGVSSLAEAGVVAEQGGLM